MLAAAERLYAVAGFAPAYVIKRHLKLDGVYYDMQMMTRLLRQGSENVP